MCGLQVQRLQAVTKYYEYPKTEAKSANGFRLVLNSAGCQGLDDLEKLLEMEAGG